MAINKKLIHFKSKTNFDEQSRQGNILDNSIVFIQDSKEISTHGTIYSTVNWSVLDLGESKEIPIYIPKLGAPFGDFIKSVQLEGGDIWENAIDFCTSITTHENFEPEITLLMTFEYRPYLISIHSNSPQGNQLPYSYEWLDNTTQIQFKVPYSSDSVYIVISPIR